MKKVLIFFFVFILTAILGTVSHFIYQWSNESVYIAFLVPTNESLFEHLKLFFFPVLFVTAIESLFVKERKDVFLTSRVYGVIFSLISCIAFYYLYTTLSSSINDAVFITSYYVSLFLGLYISYAIYKYMKVPEYLKIIAFILFLVLILTFIYYTYNPIYNEFFLV